MTEKSRFSACMYVIDVLYVIEENSGDLDRLFHFCYHFLYKMMKTKMLICSFMALCLVAGEALFAQTGGTGGAGEQGRPDALAAYRAGRDMESRNRPAEAEAYYAEAVRICNNEITQNQATRDSYTVLTWTLQRQKKYREVIAWGERGLKLYPDDLRLVEIMGEAYFYLDNYSAAMKAMQRYVNALPRGDRASVAYFFIGEIYRLESKYRRADMAYTTAVRLEPGLALWWYRLGLAREAAGDFSPAAEAFERALRLNPNYREASGALARVRDR